MSDSSQLRPQASARNYGLLAVTTIVCAGLCIGLYLLLSVPSISPMIAICATVAVAMAVAAILFAASRRRRFSIRSLFVLIAFLSVILAALSMSVRNAQHQMHAIVEIGALGGQCLTFRGSEPSVRLVPSPLVSRDLTNVYRVDLSGSKAVDKDLLLLRAFSSLGELSLADTAITDDGLRHLAQHTKLQRIDIDGSHVTVDGIIRLFEEQRRSCAQALSAIGGRPAGALWSGPAVLWSGPAVFEVEVRTDGTIVGLGCHNWELMEQVLERPEIQNVEHLNISATRVSDQELKKLASLHQLKELDVSLTPVTDIGIRELGPLTKLERISAIDTRVTFLGIRALVIDIQNRDISDALKVHGWTTHPKSSLKQTLYSPYHAQDEDLKEVGRIRSLNTLVIRSGLITDRGLKYLANLDELTSLRLRSTQITGNGLSKLSGLTKLRTLELTGSRQVTNEALLHLPNRDGIEWLGLIATGVDGQGLAYLREFKSLKELHLHPSNEIESEIAGLRQALPDTRIEVIGNYTRHSTGNGD